MKRKYIKKPVCVEAIELSWENWEAILEFVPKKFFGGGVFVDKKGNPHNKYISEGKLGLIIKTLEGNMLAIEGDYIVKGVNGEFYPVKRNIFKKTYKKAK